VSGSVEGCEAVEKLAKVGGGGGWWLVAGGVCAGWLVVVG
jgi:hypothetical protein